MRRPRHHAHVHLICEQCFTFQELSFRPVKVPQSRCIQQGLPHAQGHGIVQQTNHAQRPSSLQHLSTLC